MESSGVLWMNMKKGGRGRLEMKGCVGDWMGRLAYRVYLLVTFIEIYLIKETNS